MDDWDDYSKLDNSQNHHDATLLKKKYLVCKHGACDCDLIEF